MTTMIKNVRTLGALSIFALAIGLPSVSAAEGRFKPGDQTIAQIASGTGVHNTLVAALVCTDLVGAVANEEAELTVFAPTDDAFGALGLDEASICDAFDTETLASILLYHVVGERRPSPSVINGRNKEIMMLSGGYTFPVGRGSTYVVDNLDREVKISGPDVLASNGIIHVVDSVLLPFLP